jgi:copper ion binding protein
MDSQVLSIRGMTCAACAQRIEKMVRKLSGIQQANVNLASEKLFVEYDEQDLSIEKIKETVTRIGYEVAEKTDSSKVTIPIGGMTCAACAQRIEKMVGRLPGVESVSVNLATEKATVAYDPHALRMSQIRETIEKLGYKALEAAKILEEKYGVSAEVIDARSLVPFNYEPLLESVKKTGKLLLASDACARGGVLVEIAANVTQLAFDYLDAPPFVVGAQNWITPAFEYDAQFFPQPEWIIDAIHQKLLPLKGYAGGAVNYSKLECIRKAKAGV